MASALAVRRLFDPVSHKREQVSGNVIAHLGISGHNINTVSSGITNLMKSNFSRLCAVDSPTRDLCLF